MFQDLLCILIVFMHVQYHNTVIYSVWNFLTKKLRDLPRSRVLCVLVYVQCVIYITYTVLTSVKFVENVLIFLIKQ